MTLTNKIRVLKCREINVEIGKRTLVMGILNTTPDSFSDGGKYVTVESAVLRAKQMVEEGADFIDVGGESTRPGSQKVTLEEELKRVIPLVKALREQISAPISIDTYKAEVAKQALEAGAHMINDVWGLKADAGMPKVAAEYGCPVVVMHNREPRPYNDLLHDITADLQESVDLARQAGVRDEMIIVDPGIGFAKNYEDNLLLMNNLNRLVSLGYPVLLGTSRKTFIRNTLNRPADDVVEGTAATVALGIAQGCQIIRVHDVQALKKVALMTDAIVRQPKLF